jgi:copper oxidase (laccase) domain-containing protein
VIVESFDAEGVRIEVRSTHAADGDFRVSPDDPEELADLRSRRRAIVDSPWTWLRQVHGTDLVEVRRPGEHAGSTADGAFTHRSGAPIAVTTADCAPVVLVATTGVAVVHAGWRGAAGGIIERAGDALRQRGGMPVAAVVGPCIGPQHYAFGARDLREIVDRYGDEVAGRTRDGSAALDLPALVSMACVRAGWPRPPQPACTSDDAWFSHRTRADRGRQTTVAWIAASEPDPR